MNVLEVKFIGDEDALEHIVDKQEGIDDSLRMFGHHPNMASLSVAAAPKS